MQKLDSHNQIQITEESIRKILSVYDIFDFTYKPIHEGIANTSFVINAEIKYVLRVYARGRKSNEDVLFEIEFQDYLRNHGVPIPLIYKNSENKMLTILQIDGQEWQCLLMEFVDGHSVTANPTPELIAELAQLQAKVHLLGIDLAEHSNKPKTPWSDLHDTLASQSENIPVQTDEVHKFIERVKAYRYSFNSELPYGYNHLDLDFDGNVITKEGKVVAIVDFDDLAYSPTVVCLGYSLWNILDEQGAEAMRSYLSEYEKVRPLTPPERDALPNVIFFRNYVMGIVRLMLWEEYTPMEDMKNIFTLEHEIPQLFA